MLLQVVGKGSDTLKTRWVKFRQNLTAGSRDIHGKSATPNKKSATNEKSPPNADEKSTLTEKSAPSKKIPCLCILYIHYYKIHRQSIEGMLEPL